MTDKEASEALMTEIEEQARKFVHAYVPKYKNEDIQKFTMAMSIGAMIGQAHMHKFLDEEMEQENKVVIPSEFA